MIFLQKEMVERIYSLNKIGYRVVYFYEIGELFLMSDFRPASGLTTQTTLIGKDLTNFGLNSFQIPSLQSQPSNTIDEQARIIVERLEALPKVKREFSGSLLYTLFDII